TAGAGFPCWGRGGAGGGPGTPPKGAGVPRAAKGAPSRRGVGRRDRGGGAWGRSWAGGDDGRGGARDAGRGARPPGRRATAERDGNGGWRLNGEKWFVTSEGQPGVYVVAAVADGEQTLFLVEPDAPGLEIARTPSFLHDPYVDHHPQLVLRDCRVPDS